MNGSEPRGLRIQAAPAAPITLTMRVHDSGSKIDNPLSGSCWRGRWPRSKPVPRDPLGGAALGEMKPVDESDEETKSSPAERMAPMRRAPGGRTRVIYVRVTEEEDSEIRRRAVKHRRSAQRFLIETALSGSARLSAERSRAQRDAEMARIG